MYQRFIERINRDRTYTEEANPHSHFCCFFIPIDQKTQSLFLVHHIKANDWIPPGGHIDEGETPVQTVKREFAEELGHALTHEKIRLFDLSMISIKSINTDQICKEHYDFWYTVDIAKKPFSIDRGEFHDAGWFSFHEGVSKIQTPLFHKTIEKLGKLFVY